jgi:hypothetical protein
MEPRPTSQRGAGGAVGQPWGRRWSGDTGKDGLCYGEQGIKVEMFITVASLAEVLITILDSHAT